MKPMFRPAFSLTTIIFYMVFVASILGGVGFVLENFDLLPKIDFMSASPGNDLVGTDFNGGQVLKAIPFKDSKNKEKLFVVVNSNTLGKIPIADSYITDEKLSVNSAIKIETLSGDSNLGYAAQAPLANRTSFQVSTSENTQGKIIVVFISIGDAASVFLLDENGRLVSDLVISNILSVLGNKCVCKFVFDDWKDSERFYIKAATASKEVLRVPINAKTGALDGEIKKI